MQQAHRQGSFPQDPHEQLWGAVGAVFGSWMNKRAITYRKLNNIPDHWGTAVNVQAMVFGNMGDDCATGVCFSRNPSTGENLFYGEYLVNAQGEDVVAGIRTPQPLSLAEKTAMASDLPAMEEVLPPLYHELVTFRDRLEQHYHDMQDMEFTIQKGKLWMLQTRNGKRTAQAALRIAVEMCDEGLIDKKEAVQPRRAGAARPAAASDDRPEGQEGGAGQGPAGVAGRRLRSDRLLRRRGRELGQGGQEGHPDPHRDIAGGHRRHARRPGHPHHPRRHDQPRGGGRPRHGHAVRRRRRRSSHRLRGEDADRRQHRAERGRHHHHRRLQRPGAEGRGAEDPAGADRRLRQADGVGRRDPQAQGAGQRRDAARCVHRAQLRLRGYRPVPHRAHVLRPAADHPRPRDDRRQHRGRASDGAGQAAALPARRLRAAVHHHGRPAGDHPAARPAAARVPAAQRCRHGRGGEGGRQDRRRGEGEGEPAARGQPDARPSRLPARHHLPGNLRDAVPRDLRGGRRRKDEGRDGAAGGDDPAGRGEKRVRPAEADGRPRRRTRRCRRPAPSSSTWSAR